MSKYSEILVNEAKDLLEECINRPLAKYTIEERNELISSNKTLKWIVDHAKELPLENWDKSLIVKSNYSPIFFSMGGGFSGKIPYNMVKNIQKELSSVFGDKENGRFYFYDKNGDLVEESFYLKKPHYNGESYVMNYNVRIYDNETTKSVCKKIIADEDFEYPTIENKFNEWMNK